MLHQLLDPMDCLNVLPESHSYLYDMSIRLSKIRDSGQSVRGIAAPHPDLPSKYIVANNFPDCLCCRQLGIGFRAYVLDRPFIPGEAIATRIEYLMFHEPDGIFEIADLLRPYFEAIRARTWKDVSIRLQISESEISRIRSLKRIPQEERLSFRGLPPSHAKAIGNLHRRVQRYEAIRFAKHSGRCCTLRELKRYLADLKCRQDSING